MTQSEYKAIEIEAAVDDGVLTLDLTYGKAKMVITYEPDQDDDAENDLRELVMSLPAVIDRAFDALDAAQGGEVSGA